MTVTYNIYQRETLDQTPVAIATGLNSKNHAVSDLTKGKKYLFSVGVVRNGLEKISNEKLILAGIAWTPSNLTNTPKIWLDSDNVLTSGSQITQATDLSGNNYHFTQSTAQYRPTVEFDSSINHNTIKFDGLDDDLRNLQAQAVARNVSKFWTLVIYKKRSTDSIAQTKTILQTNRGDAATGNARLGIYAGFNTVANASSIYVRPSDSASNSTSITGSVKSQEWTILFTEWDGAAQKINLSQDGIFTSYNATGIASTTSNTQPTVAPLMIGAGTFAISSSEVNTNR